MAIATTLSEPGISIKGIVGGTIESDKFALFADASGTANFINTDSTASLQIFGDIEAHFEVAYDEWNGVESFIMTKGPTNGSPRDYYFRVGVFGQDKLDTHIVADPGTGNGNSNASTVATGFANFSRHWIRYVWDDSASEATWYTGDDGINWIQLGDAQSLTSDGQNISDGDLNLGSTSAGSSQVVGRLYRARLYSGLTDENGTLVADFNPNDHVSGPTITSSATGEVWTLNGAVTIEED